jgi:cob(I)alamin adenosyltransferase
MVGESSGLVTASEVSMKIYTRGGDRGETALLGGGRVPKSHQRIEAYGTVDELNSLLGLVRASWSDSPIDDELAAVQSDLFEVGALLASPGSERFPGAAADRILQLEKRIDAMESGLEPLTSFILPGGSLAAAWLHLARTVCRRAERLVVGLEREGAELRETIPYLNRLSDFLFVAARLANRQAGVPDVPWHPVR